MDSTDLLTALAASDPGRRADALSRVRFRHLKDPNLLAQVLDCCRDPRTWSDAPPTAADPFAAFFEGGVTTSTVAQTAAGRIAAAGLPPDDASVAVLARSLRTESIPDTLGEVLIDVLGTTRFDDLDGALRQLVPLAVRHDLPMYSAIARIPEAGTPTLAALATTPLAPRLWQELLNHPPSHEAAVAAVVEAARARCPPPADVMTILAVLTGFDAIEAVGRVTDAVASTHPWATAWAALHDPTAAAGFATWLATAPAMPHLADRLAETLVQRGPTHSGDDPTFPLAATLAWAEDDRGILEAWAPRDPDTLALVARWAADRSTPRGWRAVRHLATANALDRAAPLEPETVPWRGGLLAALATTAPPLPWIADFLLDGVEAQPTAIAEAVPALIHLGPEVCRRALVRGVAMAEAAPETASPVDAQRVRIARGGIDVEALIPLVNVVADPQLTERLSGLLPIVRRN